MALDELRERIERDAKAEASRIGREAEAEAGRVLGAARKEAAEAKKRARESAERESDEKAKDAKAALEDEIEGMLSSARQEAIGAQLAEFGEAVKDRLSLRERDIIRSAIAEFSRVARPEHSVIRISKRHADLAGRAIGKVEHAEMRGASISSLDGRVTADATVDGLAEANSDAIRRALAGRLFR